MLNYIHADLNRLFKRVPRIVVFLIFFVVFCLAVFIYTTVLRTLSDPAFEELGIFAMGDRNIVFEAIGEVAGYLVGFFGLFELIFVFSDDLKAKTAQIAIGVGVSRIKVVFSKLIELLVLFTMDAVILLGLSALMGGLLGSALSAAELTELAARLASGMILDNISYICLVFMLLFATQSMTLGILSFLALHFNIVSGVIGLTGYIKALKSLNLGSYTLSSMLGKIGDMAEGAAVNPMPFVAVAAYILVSLAITSLIYRKKELEF